MGTLWPLGVAIYVSGTVGESLGANLQRLSSTTNAAKPADERVSKSRQRMWVGGFILFVISGIFMSMALFFASQTQLAPMQLFLFVSNILFAHLLNKEIFYFRTDGIATLTVVAGVVLAVVAAPKENHDFNNEQMLELMRAPSFIAFIVMTVTFILALYIAQRTFMKQCGGRPRLLGQRWKRYTIFLSYGALAGALGGLNVTLTKSTFSLIVGQFNDEGIVGVLSSPVLWLTAVTLLSTFFLQMLFTVVGIDHCSPVIIISTHAVTEEVTAALGGILFFQDYRYFEAWEWAVFLSGNFMAVVAVVFLAHFRLRYEKVEAGAGAKGVRRSTTSSAEEASGLPVDIEADAAATSATAVAEATANSSKIDEKPPPSCSTQRSASTRSQRSGTSPQVPRASRQRSRTRSRSRLGERSGGKPGGYTCAGFSGDAAQIVPTETVAAEAGEAPEAGPMDVHSRL